MVRKFAVFLRHGRYHQLADTPSARQPFALTTAGLQDAADGATLVQRMADEHGWRIHAVLHTSNSLRAWQTAEVLRNALSQLTRVQGSDELAERGVGCAANLSLAQIEAVLRDDPRYSCPPAGWKTDRHYRLPLQGAESLMEAGARVAGYLRDTLAQLPASHDEPDHKGVMCLFVGHGAALRHAMHELGVLSLADVHKFSLHHARPIAFEAQADGVWSHVAGDWKLREPSAMAGLD